VICACRLFAAHEWSKCNKVPGHGGIYIWTAGQRVNPKTRSKFVWRVMCDKGYMINRDMRYTHWEKRTNEPNYAPKPGSESILVDSSRLEAPKSSRVDFTHLNYWFCWPQSILFQVDLKRLVLIFVASFNIDCQATRNNQW